MQIPRIQATPQKTQAQPNFKGFVGVRILEETLGTRSTYICDKFIGEAAHYETKYPGKITSAIVKDPDSKSTFVTMFFPVGLKAEEEEFKLTAETFANNNPEKIIAKHIKGYYMDARQEFLNFLADK